MPGTAQPLWSTDICAGMPEAETLLRDKEVVTTNHSSRCGQNMPLNLRSTQAEKSLIDKSALEIKWGDLPGVQRLSLHALSARGAGSIPDQETRPHMQQPRVHILQLKISRAAMKIKDPAQQVRPTTAK